MVHYTKHEKGFTLVELAVSLVISSLIMIAIIGIFILQGRAYTATRMSTELQNNARTALDTIDSMVSMSGLGIVKSTMSPPNVPTNLAFAFDSAAFYFPDYTNLPSIGMNNGQDNYMNSTMDGTQCSAQSIPPAQNGGPCPYYGTDSLTFAYRLPQYQGIVTGIDTGLKKVTYTDNYPYMAFNPGDVMFLIDQGHKMSAFATVASNSSGGGSGGSASVLLSSTNTGSAGFYNELTAANPNLALVAATIANNGYIDKVNVVHVYVDYGDPNHPVLMMSINSGLAFPLANNIEDFQVQFVMDDSVPSTDYNLLGSWSQQYTNTYALFPSFSNNMYDPTEGNDPHQNPYNINAIILTIVTRSDSPSVSVATPPQALIADHNTSLLPYPTPNLGPLQNYQRQIYRRIIQLPNIRAASKLYDNSFY